MVEQKTVAVDIESIMNDIRRKIKMEEEMNALPLFESIPFRDEGSVKPVAPASQLDWAEYLENLDYVNRNYNIPYYWSFGPNRSIKVFLKRVVRKLVKCIIPPILARQNEMNAHYVRCLNQLRWFVEKQNTENAALREELSALNEQLEQFREMSTQKWAEHHDMIHYCIDEIRRELSEHICQREDTVAADLAQLTELQKQTTQLLTGFDRQKKDLEAAKQRIEQLDRQSDAFSASVAKSILEYSSIDVVNHINKPEIPQKNESDTMYGALDYFKFQNYFRGTRSQIKERQRRYLEYFQGREMPIVDIGCGRGEFLSLLKENHIPAFGVDLYPEYVIEGKLQNLDVRQGDGIEFLKNTHQQFGGIFAAQVIEHISFSDLQTLCFAAYEKLAAGSYLILETPNPMCLMVYASSFYVDPTHIRPVHPLLLQYILREAGFTDVQVLFTPESRLSAPLPLIRGTGIENLEEVNAAISNLSELLYGSQDYAIIARK